MSSVPASSSYSGKRLTVVLMIVLLSTGGLFFWVTTAYSTYNAARRQTDRDWRELATLLENRYQVIDKRLAGAESPPVDAQLAEQWRAARDAFTATGLSGRQIDSAEKVEEVIERLPPAITAGETRSEQLNIALEKYGQSASRQREIGQSLGSKLLKIMLNLPDPKDISLQ